jgi:cellulose synthase/poly-beta-1,6-N-acetylglucosamine synthase-like glycosyltransferase
LPDVTDGLPGAPAISPLAISFVVPAYNEEALLPKTLEAILAEIRRTTCAADIIVVNNASSDSTAAVARSFEGVRVIDEPVKSLVRARRAGFVAARGRLIANVDADTVLPPGWLRQVLLEFDANPVLVGLSGPYVYNDISRAKNLAVRLFYLFGYGFYILNRFVFRVGSMLQGGNFVVTREALARIGGNSDAFSFYGEDTDVARRLTAVGDVKFTFKLGAFSSGRRLAKEGVVVMGLRYALNFVWATFLRRPFTRNWKDIR